MSYLMQNQQILISTTQTGTSTSRPSSHSTLSPSIALRCAGATAKFTTYSTGFLEANLQHRTGHMFSNKFLTYLSKKNEVGFVCLDFAQASDKVSHNQLLVMLHNICIRGNLLQWFRDFLCGRFQRMKHQNRHSLSTVMGPSYDLFC